MEVCIWLCRCMIVLIFRCMFSGGVLEYCLCSLRRSNSDLCSWMFVWMLEHSFWATEWCLGIYFSYVYLSSVLWQLTVCLGCYENLFFLICPLLQVSDFLGWYLFVSLVCIFPCVVLICENIGSRIWDMWYTSYSLEDFDVTEELYGWYRFSYLSLWTFLQGRLFCEDWRKGCMWSLFFVWTGRLKLF